MKTTATELLNGRVGAALIHPDDELPHVHALQATDGKVSALVYTLGKRSTHNYRHDEGFSVATGDRGKEHLAAAPYLNIATSQLLDFPDGRVFEHVDELAGITADWIIEEGLETVLTLGGLSDHADHRAGGLIGRLAARQAAEVMGRPVHVLELQDRRLPGARTIHLEATPEGMERAMHGARAHGSQFQLEQGIVGDWPIVPGGYSMSPATYQDLSRYPIFHDPNYLHYFYLPNGRV
jgi:LmbE family N-acetylglucosaminyl deacetylase